MRIINSGKKKNEDITTFECANCGCVFEADKDEYHIEQNNLSDCCITVNTLNFKIFANCPECHKMCQAKKEIKSSSLSTSYYVTSCNGKINCNKSWQTSTTISGENNNATLTGEKNE